MQLANPQFIFACLTATFGLLGASWIIAQSLNRTRSATEEFQQKMIDAVVLAVQTVGSVRRVPEYDSRFQEGDRRMDELARQLETLQAANNATQKDMAVQIHSVNNLKQRFEGVEYSLKDIRDKMDAMPLKIVNLLRSND